MQQYMQNTGSSLWHTVAVYYIHTEAYLEAAAYAKLQSDTK